MNDETLRHVQLDIEDPIPIIFWDPIEFIFSLVVFGVFVTFDFFFLGGVLAVCILVGAKYLRRGAKKGTTQHYLWSLGLMIDPVMKKHFPPPWDNDFIE